jgi:hypothetical protein
MVATAALVWGWQIVGVPAAAGQGARESSTASIVLGWNSASSDWFSGLYAWDGFNRYTSDIGGGVVSLRILRGVAPRVRIGGEVGILTVNHGGSGEVITPHRRPVRTCAQCFGATAGRRAVREGDGEGPLAQVITTTYYVPAGTEPDDAGIHVNALASLRLATTGRMTWRIEGGAGFMYWNLDEAGRAYGQNLARKAATGTAYYDSKPGMEPMVVARLIPTIVWGGTGPSRAAFALDPSVSYVSTLGTTATSSIVLALGLGVQLGGR